LGRLVVARRDHFQSVGTETDSGDPVPMLHAVERLPLHTPQPPFALVATRSDQQQLAVRAQGYTAYGPFMVEMRMDLFVSKQLPNMGRLAARRRDDSPTILIGRLANCQCGDGAGVGQRLRSGLARAGVPGPHCIIFARSDNVLTVRCEQRSGNRASMFE